MLADAGSLVATSMDWDVIGFPCGEPGLSLVIATITVSLPGRDFAGAPAQSRLGSARSIVDLLGNIGLYLTLSISLYLTEVCGERL